MTYDKVRLELGEIFDTLMIKTGRESREIL